MKTLITATALVLVAASAAYAADDKMGMKQGDMMRNCQMHMKDGKMMDNMPKNMMLQCQEMMKNGGMMQQDGMKDMKPSDAIKPAAPKAADDAEHKAHHPVQ